MYLLNDTPIFLEFLKRFLKFVDLEFRNRKIQNKLFIYSKCNCGEKDCGTVYLKSNKLFKNKVQGVYFFDTNKGYFIINISEDGFFDFEALCYEKFPFKKEIDKYFKNKKSTHDLTPRHKKEIKKLTIKDKQILHRYFKDLKLNKPNIIDLGEINFDEEESEMSSK